MTRAEALAALPEEFFNWREDTVDALATVRVSLLAPDNTVSHVVVTGPPPALPQMRAQLVAACQQTAAKLLDGATDER